MLSDGHVTYTPGLSENRGGTSSYTASDVLGNLWFLDNASAQQTYYQDTSAFGTPVASAGSGSVFGFGGANGCQTDSDIGLVLMGHRYYDTRIGRFITQDPAGNGDNWYAYAGNNPTNEIDASGLSDGLPGSLGAPDSHYGGLGGFLDGGGMSSLDGFWDDQNAAMERGHDQYLAYQVIDAVKIWGPNGYTNYVTHLLDEIAASPIGLQLLDTAFYNKTVIGIEYIHTPNDPNSAYNFRTGILSYDPALHPQVYTADGLSDAPPVSVLEHELGHNITGLLDPPNSDTIFDTGGKDNIAVNENPFREYLGLPDRIDHNAEKGSNGSWFDPSW